MRLTSLLILDNYCFSSSPFFKPSAMLGIAWVELVYRCAPLARPSPFKTMATGATATDLEPTCIQSGTELSVFLYSVTVCDTPTNNRKRLKK